MMRTSLLIEISVMRFFFEEIFIKIVASATIMCYYLFCRQHLRRYGKIKAGKDRTIEWLQSKCVVYSGQNCIFRKEWKK